MFKAAIMALILQCGIAIAAAIITIYTPTIGVGCRSLGYIIYGGIAIAIMFLNITSTILVRISETHSRRSTAKDSTVKASAIKNFITKHFTAGSLTGFTAITLRRLSLFLALANTVGLILFSFFQFSDFLDNCYCNASVMGLGTDSYVLITTYEGWDSAIRSSRIAATVIAAACTTIYMVVLWFISAPPEVFDYF